MKMGFESKSTKLTWQYHNYRKESRDFLVAPGKYSHYALRSNQESKFARLLEMLVLSESVLHWWYEPHRFDLGWYWEKHRYYTPDFLIQMGDDDIFDTGTRSAWLEVKAALTQKDVSRFRWFKAKYPFLPILCMVQRRPPGQSKTANRQRVVIHKAEKYCERILYGNEWYFLK